MINNAVALGDNTALELPFGMTLRKLRILFNTKGKEVTEVHLYAIRSSLAGDITPFTNRQLIPHDLGSQTIPFKAERFTGFRVASDFSLSDRAGHHGRERNRTVSKLITMGLWIIGENTSPRVLSGTMRGSPEATHRHAWNSISVRRIIAAHSPRTLSSKILTVYCSVCNSAS